MKTNIAPLISVRFRSVFIPKSQPLHQKLESQISKHFYISVCPKEQQHTDGVQNLMLFVCSLKSDAPKNINTDGVQSLMLFM
jgi:hypothetical protein